MVKGRMPRGFCGGLVKPLLFLMEGTIVRICFLKGGNRVVVDDETGGGRFAEARAVNKFSFSSFLSNLEDSSSEEEEDDDDDS